MKTKWTLTTLAAGMAIISAASAAEGWVTYNSKPGKGNLVFIEGTSTVHDWRVQGPVIGGKFLAGPGFTTDAANAKPGKVEAKTENGFIPVRALKSVKEDGSPYSESMDQIMYEKLKMEQHRNIKFELKEMTLKEVPQAAGGPFVFNVKGTIEVAGVAKEFEFPVQMTVDPTNSKVLTFAGEVAAKMTDFGIEPVSALAGTIKTGDEIKLGISWVVQEAVKR